MTPSPPAPATPYHRLARTPAHRWWRAPVGTVFLLGCWIVFGSALVCGSGFAISVATGHLHDAKGSQVSGVVETAGTLLFIGVVIPAVFLAARVVQRRRGGTVSSVVGRLR